MEPSQVHYISARSTKWSYKESLAGRFETLLKEIPFSTYLKKKEPAALKTHFGSEGAHRVVRPLFIRKVAEAVKRAGAKPFVTDTVRIKGLDYLQVANANGINEWSCGAPVLLADGIFGNDNVRVPAGEEQGEVLVASAIHDVPSMIVLSHFKGHVNAGIGGAIKNLAMGGLSGSSRNHDWKHGRGGMHAHHTEGVITWDSEKCSHCDQCVEVCPLEACSFDNELFHYNQKKCWRCGRCVRVCPEGSLYMPMDEDRFHKGLAESAKAVLSTFKKKILYINFLLEIQPECDCMPNADVPVIQDLGILVSDDLVSVDQASLDLLRQSPPLPGSMAEDHGIKAGEDILLKLHQIDGQKHIDAAFELGMGNKAYHLNRL